MHVEDEAFWANNMEGFNHDPGPRQEPVGKMLRGNRAVVEPLFNPPGLNGEAEGRPPGEQAIIEPVMECGITDVGRPDRVRRPR